MAKKEKAEKKETGSKEKEEWITCTNYRLVIKTSPVFSLTLDNILPGDLDLNDQEFEHPPLVKEALKAIADIYPNIDWQFQLDEDGEITKVQSKPK